MTEKYRFMRGEEGNYIIGLMCRCLKVSRSGYYNWRMRKLSERARSKETLTAHIRRVFVESDSTYGYRRVHAQLSREGVRVDDDTVRTIMRSEQLIACQPRPFRPVTTIAADAAGLPDLVRRDFTADAPARKLVGDITYIRTWQGWLYLATVLDCFSKKVVGYAMDKTMTTPLVVAALTMATNRVSITHGNTIFHSDRGCQYMSHDFAVAAANLGIRRSVGRTGICYDNAWAESFNGTLKNERVNRTAYPTRDHARKDIIKYIELRYNRIRLHSALDYRTPNEVESEWLATNRAA